MACQTSVPCPKLASSRRCLMGLLSLPCTFWPTPTFPPSLFPSSLPGATVVSYGLDNNRFLGLYLFRRLAGVLPL